jgi:diguanylate cyclase (GGDEF)-like protein
MRFRDFNLWQRISPQNQPILFSSLLLGLHTFGLFLLSLGKTPILNTILLILPLPALLVIPYLLLIQKPRALLPYFVTALLLTLFIHGSLQPGIPIVLFLTVPLYQFMVKIYPRRYGFAMLLGLSLLLLLRQSGLLFFLSASSPSPALSPAAWLISLITILPVVWFLTPLYAQSNQQQSIDLNLVDSREEYFLAAEAVDIGLWSWNVLENQVKLSSKCIGFLGLPNPNHQQTVTVNGITPLLQTLHLEDKDTLNQALFDLANARQTSFETNVRVMSNPDAQRWIRIRAHSQTSDHAAQILQIAGSMVDVTQRIQFERKSQFFETFDALTNLPNKKSICDQINTLINEAPSREELNFGVMILNIDRFNAINESLGRMIGDDLLKAFSQRLERCMRMVDGVARLGEDSFIILVSEINSYRNIHLVAERIQERVKLPYWIQRNEIYLTAGIGIALYHAEINCADEILQEAEIAMFNAKAKGHGTHAIYQPEMREIVTRRHQMETDLRKAIENQEFELYYQPILSTASGTISGAEALIRWHHPINGMIPPTEFIPIAEATGLIIPIGDWVLETACRQLSEIRKNYPETQQLTMSVNLSAMQLCDKLVCTVRRILSENQLSGSSLILEITETTVMRQSEMVSRLIKELRDQKVRIHIDDFGTGYSSFQYLQNFPVDSIKIDRSFISQLENSRNNYEIVRTVVNLAHELGMTIIAEGVETLFQHEQVTKFGCESMQGFLISKPIPFNELIEFIMASSFMDLRLDENLV